ncbi:cytochrome-c oxidase, cbb3-type subunit III [Caulobacter sp. 17J80-11]|uniref:cytochrome-c oxidase, cbb3-type subunit III n=1 Tax=Caulobacter sp. 17J80-11 TaxID=2763502 RepID=UPI001653DCAF|nr:cytochrome-c oxidase, cbb3-type subunit III [Caulobacter sp. 17J80-11]MBC6983768.1 cytochrome-c oxidase, cbb3-type subunit III [Caulobacter sp. 17J80-11]
MSEPHDDKDAGGVETTGHEWDGIRELDNPLPRWWLWVWYATIAWALVYWVLMPAWPGISGYTRGLIGQSDRADVAAELSRQKAERGVIGAKLLAATPEQIERDPELQAYALAAGQAAFGDNCATCHGSGGAGAKGYPNLRDDVWLWGGSPEQIERTIRVGVRSSHPDTHTSQMPAFGRDGMLQPAQVSDVTEYVFSLSHRDVDKAKAGRGAQIFADNCAACHGPTGKGGPEYGAPDLTDADWLYGADRDSIQTQVWNGRNGVMPTWENRLDPATIRALAVYVHANSGGGR